MKIYDNNRNLPQTWDDARSRCQLQGGELASLRDSEQKVRDKEWREKGQEKTERYMQRDGAYVTYLQS